MQVILRAPTMSKGSLTWQLHTTIKLSSVIQNLWRPTTTWYPILFSTCSLNYFFFLMLGDRPLCSWFHNMQTACTLELSDMIQIGCTE
jgi:hypothetical protein